MHYFEFMTGSLKQLFFGGVWGRGEMNVISGDPILLCLLYLICIAGLSAFFFGFIMFVCRTRDYH